MKRGYSCFPVQSLWLADLSTFDATALSSGPGLRISKIGLGLFRPWVDVLCAYLRYCYRPGWCCAGTAGPSRRWAAIWHVVRLVRIPTGLTLSCICATGAGCMQTSQAAGPVCPTLPVFLAHVSALQGGFVVYTDVQNGGIARTSLRGLVDMMEWAEGPRTQVFQGKSSPHSALPACS